MRLERHIEKPVYVLVRQAGDKKVKSFTVYGASMGSVYRFLRDSIVKECKRRNKGGFK